MNYTKRDLVKTALATTAVSLLPTASILRTGAAKADEPVKVGILHSLSGSIAIAEVGVVDAEKLAMRRSTPPAAYLVGSCR